MTPFIFSKCFKLAILKAQISKFVWGSMPSDPLDTVATAFLCTHLPPSPQNINPISGKKLCWIRPQCRIIESCVNAVTEATFQVRGSGMQSTSSVKMNVSLPINKST